MCCPSCSFENPPGMKFCGQCATPLTEWPTAPQPQAPLSYTPGHLAEKILASKTALEGERKRATVLFTREGARVLLVDGVAKHAAATLAVIRDKGALRKHMYDNAAKFLVALGDRGGRAWRGTSAGALLEVLGHQSAEVVDARESHMQLACLAAAVWEQSGTVSMSGEEIQDRVKPLQLGHANIRVQGRGTLHEVLHRGTGSGNHPAAGDPSPLERQGALPCARHPRHRVRCLRAG